MIFIGSPFFYIALLVCGIFLIVRKKMKSLPLKIVFVNGIIILFFTALFDTIAVAMFFNVDPFRTLDNRFHHTLKPFINEKTMWDKQGRFSYNIKTNSLGFVDDSNRIVDLKKKGKRIMFIGDSFIEGVGYKWEDTAAGILSERLKEKNIELLNASVASYSPKLYLLKTEYFLELGLEIDELFVFIDISDIIDEVVYDYFVPMKFSKFKKRLNRSMIFLQRIRFFTEATLSTTRSPSKIHIKKILLSGAGLRISIF